MAVLIAAMTAATAYVAGRDAAVGQAAVDQKRLADVEVRAQAASDGLVAGVLSDTKQDMRIEALERQHSEVMERLNRLIDVLWDRRRSDTARKPGE